MSKRAVTQGAVLLTSLFILTTPVFANQCGFNYDQHPNIRVKRVIGTIKEINRNTIVVFDETDKILRTFVDVANGAGFIVGNRVRILYLTKDNTVESIKKVKPVEYIKNSQNLGYIFQK
ncbi:MAG: hypothetical protein HQL14_05820 [Candidatus Omnitrophica bacterium]|nr:hypothetical protein [Candidatus Omnitrophota bacterium]